MIEVTCQSQAGNVEGARGASPASKPALQVSNSNDKIRLLVQVFMCTVVLCQRQPMKLELSKRSRVARVQAGSEREDDRFS